MTDIANGPVQTDRGTYDTVSVASGGSLFGPDDTISPSPSGDCRLYFSVQKAGLGTPTDAAYVAFGFGGPKSGTDSYVYLSATDLIRFAAGFVKAAALVQENENRLADARIAVASKEVSDATR